MSWRVDKDEGPTLFNRMRGNLLALTGSDRRAARLRALLMDSQPPRVLAAEQSFTQRLDSQSQVRRGDGDEYTGAGCAGPQCSGVV